MKKRINWIHFLLCLTLLASALTACQTPKTPASKSASLPAPGSLFGISGTFNLTGLFPGSVAGWARSHEQYPLWESIEPQPGERNWAAVADLEKWILESSGQGSQVILVVGKTPAWALKPGHTAGAVAPEQMAAFGQFMTDLVRRYSMPPYNVKYWELWNEPDAAQVLGDWGEPNDPYYGGKAYGEMLKQITPMIKAADPTAQVLVGGLLLNADPAKTGLSEESQRAALFFKGVLEAGAGSAFDGVSFHGYDYYGYQAGVYGNSNWNAQWDITGPAFGVKAQYLKDLLTQYQLSGKYLMSTENALICPKDGTELECQGAEYENTKSAYLVQSYALATALGLRANIWYSAVGWRGSGLLNPDSSARPSYAAYTFAAHMLGNAKYATEMTGRPGLKGYGFTQDGRQFWVLWSVSGPQDVAWGTAPAAVYDTWGQALPASAVTSINWQPVYVEFAP
ncbi:MAG TPA: cellulase family glycosylhydrolase [Anaerolineaceae bacterium]|nr:cellulase family glycosylhydrolase [Anaerolineaceae bacterium]HPN53416.1 cellulase family glycosylhydrolase [Anaerolineaceae bacterium]